MNIRSTMKKLQTAILQYGLVIKINSHQFYSADQRRMITMYALTTPVDYYSERASCWKVKDHEIIKTASLVDTLLCMADIYRAVSDA